MRIIFMGTPEFAVPSLKAIAANNEFKLILVVTGTDKPRRNKNAEPEPSPVKQAAISLGLPVYETDDVNSLEFAEIVAAERADVIVVAAFRILPSTVFEEAALGAVNLHASLLPAYRGAAPINWSIINGDRETGLTTFFLQKRVDTGNIILQENMTIDPAENATDLASRLSVLGACVVTDTLHLIASHQVVVSTQDEALVSKAPKLTRNNTRISWSQPVRNVNDFIRGLATKPTAWTTFNGKTMKIFKASPGAPFSEAALLSPGTVFVDNGKLYASCSDGWLEVLSLQLEGRKLMEAAEFLRGFRHDSQQQLFV